MKKSGEETIARQVKEIASKLDIDIDLDRPVHPCTAKRAWKVNLR